MDQLDKPTVQALTNAHTSQLSAQRDWVAGHFDDMTLYHDTANKLRVITKIIETVN